MGGTPEFGGMSGVVYGLFGYVWIKSMFCRNRDFTCPQVTVIIMIIWLFLCMTGPWGRWRTSPTSWAWWWDGRSVRALVLETMTEESVHVADKFDPYREALVVESVTVWPADWRTSQPTGVPRWKSSCTPIRPPAAQLEYIRVHTGFCRRITVTPADLARLSPLADIMVDPLPDSHG